jgi:IMP and pyridine-specific 5'-nucleotidase
VFESRDGTVEQMADLAHRRYAEIMQDVEAMIDDHSNTFHLTSKSMLLIFILVAHQNVGLHGQSKLKLLVPSVGTFFTRLPLAAAFKYQDRKRFISSRRFVPPSFNDIRLILNTAQLMGVTNVGDLDLATFDGGKVNLSVHHSSFEAFGGLS